MDDIGTPISPETADKLARLLEVMHIERSFSRLPEWVRHTLTDPQ